jgi:hypothetical protein
MAGARTRYGNFFIAFLGACLFFGFGMHTASAALLYFDPGEADVYRGDTVTVGLRIDTDEDECINTVDAVVHYDPSIRAVDVSRGSSILNLWVEEPKIDETNHTITFAGGLPGGYCGRIPGDPVLTNVIAEIVFRSPGLSIGGGDNQSGRIWLGEESQVLLHDGYGTKASLRLQEAHINLLDTAGGAPSDTWTNEVQADTELPSDFDITLAKDDYAFSGKYFIAFNSIDKQSGIDHYEVMEEPFTEFYSFKWGRANAPWVKTQSPYVLVDQTLNSTIRVKVIDKAGNERITVFVPDVALRSMSRDSMIVWALGSAIGILFVGLIVYAFHTRKQKLLAKNNEEHV